MLGILPELGYVEQRTALEEGDLLAVYSDGVTEETSPSGEEFGEVRLAEVLSANRDKDAAAVVDAVLDRLHEWNEGAPPADDVTLVVARIVG